jgi:hypothetical protein
VQTETFFYVCEPPRCQRALCGAGEARPCSRMRKRRRQRILWRLARRYAGFPRSIPDYRRQDLLFVNELQARTEPLEICAKKIYKLVHQVVASRHLEINFARTMSFAMKLARVLGLSHSIMQVRCLSCVGFPLQGSMVLRLSTSASGSPPNRFKIYTKTGTIHCTYCFV